MKKRRIQAAFVLAAVLLAGCSKSPETAEQDTVYVSGKGKVSSAIVEEFGKSYYSADGLKAMLDEEMEEYRRVSGNENSVKLKSFELKDGVIRINMEYASAADYKSFNGEELFCGTVGEAYEAGYNFDIPFVDVKSAGQADKNSILEKGKHHIVILTEPVQVSTRGKILYTTANVTCLSGKLAQVNPEKEKQELAYIIYKK